MQINNQINSGRIAKLLLATLFIALGGLFAVNGNAQSAPPQRDLASAVEARAELSRIPRERIGRIKDAAIRAKVNRAVTALEAVANNKSAEREAGLVQTAQQGIDDFINTPTPPSYGCFGEVVGGFKACQKNCKASGKKFCGCFAIAVVETVGCIL